MTEVEKCPWCVDGHQFVLSLHGAKAGTAFVQACFCSTGQQRLAEIKAGLDEEAQGKGTTVSWHELAERLGVHQRFLEHDAEWHRRARIASLQKQLDALRKEP